MMVDGSQVLIQKLRLQRGWSQEQLAELSGLSVRTIQRLEGGKPASTESLKAIASVFEIDFARLQEPTMDPALNKDISANEALALAHVKSVKKFYLSLVQYVIVMAILAVINAVFSWHYPWVLWVAFWWGIALIMRAVRIFQLAPFFNGAWEQRQVEKYLGRKLKPAEPG
jgi:transcriptional regulator with XRE-family HTH domain